MRGQSSSCAKMSTRGGAMLRAFSDLKSLSLGAIDGDIGTVKDAYFDDRHWTLRYLVATTGSWLSGRTVLLVPQAIRGVGWERKRVDVDLTCEQVRDAPGIEFDKPVSRQQEASYFDYFGYPYYWSGPTWGGLGATGGAEIAAAQLAQRAEAASRKERDEDKGDPHLRSAEEVHGYTIKAQDGELGSVKDFLFEDTNWSLRYFVLDTRKWLPGRKVLISTDWIENVSWESRAVEVAMLREEVRASPEYDPNDLRPEQEESLHRHYGREAQRPTRVQIR